MPFNAALSGLQSANSELSVLANNIANASTVGFKQSRAEFRDVFAAGALGSSANIIGTGVKLTSVTQQFTQGIINSADTNLDLAINGPGFFVLDEGGSRLYSRSGGFIVDKDGNISNSQQQKLIGFLTDENGNITGAQGSLTIQNNSLDPKKTDTVSATLNLDSSLTPPQTDFIPGFVPGNEPASTTYNNSASTQIYDSLGNSHILTMYYVKSPAERTWQVFIGIDGTDVTPTATSVPAGGSPSAPVTYDSTDLAKPFTIVFDQGGKVVVNNPASPAQHFGPVPISSADITTQLIDAGNLPQLNINDLSINGVPIAVANTTDTSSTTDNVASVITIVDAINDKTSQHKVTATRNSTIWDADSGTYGTGVMASGDLVINGIDVTGDISAQAGATNTDKLVTLINNSNSGSGIPGVVASNQGGELRLTAVDGRNIQIQADGTTASGVTFTNLALNGGSALNKVKRGSYNLTVTNNRGITIGGNNPGDVGLVAGTQAGISQSNSDNLLITYHPGTGATSPQTVSIDLTSSTQFASPFSITALTQDGYSTGRLTGVDVDPSGVITARFGNGQSQQLGQVALANFRNPQGLQPQGDTTWAETFASGVALLGAPGTSDLGLISSGSLEDSNVQLTEELVSLIVAQRNFQANAQTIRTADAVTQTIINIR